MGVKNILLVDDDPGVNFLNKFLLNEARVVEHISTAANGQEAIDLISTNGECPDVIFLDINMPVMDGFGFLEQLQQRGQCYEQSKVYMLTSSLRDTDKARAASYSCVAGYLEKPLSEKVIKELFAS